MHGERVSKPLTPYSILVIEMNNDCEIIGVVVDVKMGYIFNLLQDAKIRLFSLKIEKSIKSTAKRLILWLHSIRRAIIH